MRLLHLEPKPFTPVRVTVADGRLLTQCNRQVTLDYSIASVPQHDSFLVTLIGEHSLILGMPWLQRVNPRIDWPTQEVQLPLSSTLESTASNQPLTSTPRVDRVATVSSFHQEEISEAKMPHSLRTVGLSGTHHGNPSRSYVGLDDPELP